ncbi:hypothetical protein [Kingella sp. (in: b-proteobacteria)]|nr:hypothetical protein [Kingella sp. (in: b-proteobacteria)]MDO4658241.1 hypothetical protein [Kingella sp. (in: b-proteobacteria)]
MPDLQFFRLPMVLCDCLLLAYCQNRHHPYNAARPSETRGAMQPIKAA